MEEYFFPYNEIRPGQKEMLGKVDECIKKQKHLIVHAPTGIGKTAAALGPAIKRAEEDGLTVFFLTSRHTQHLIALETIKLLKEKFGLKFHTSDIIGKRKMCLQPGAEMLYDFFEFCKQLKENNQCEYYDNARESATKMTPKAKKILEEIEDISDHDSENIKEICDRERLCPYEMAIELGKKAKVVICDYNYIFDPSIRDSFLGKIDKDLEKSIVIVDEGHNVPSRTRNILTYNLTSTMLRRGIKEAKKYALNEQLNSLVGMQEVLLDLSNKLSIGEEKLLGVEDFRKKLAKVKEFDTIIDELEEAADEVRKQQRQSYLGSIANFMDNWKGDDTGFVRFIAKNKGKEGEMIQLSYRCLDPSLVTSGAIKGAHSTVLMSGTLTPVEMYKDLLGYPDRTELLTLPSPFPDKNKLNIVIPKTTTQYKKRDLRMYEEIAKHCSEVVNTVPGNSAIFFPSYNIMKNVYQYMETDKTTFLEDRSLTKKERKQLLNKFHMYKETGGVLLGVASGSFGEGVDLPGDLLKAVVIVGLPLQRPNLETKKLISYYDFKFGKGWDYGYINPAFSKTLQNAGRCIRSETDRGIIVFLDERFSWPNYFKHFPPEMPIKISLDYKKKIEEFFSHS
ncbi:MAG: ATP-dependent DNA helicase [Nanobdellota archaeon]